MSTSPPPTEKMVQIAIERFTSSKTSFDAALASFHTAKASFDLVKGLFDAAKTSFHSEVLEFLKSTEHFASAEEKTFLQGRTRHQEMEEKLNAKLQKRSADLDTEATSTLSSSIAELSDLETRVRDCRETLDKVHETFSKSDCNAEQVLSDTLSGVRSTSRVIDGLKKNYHNLEKGWEALERERRTFREERAALEMKMAMPIGMDEESVVKMHSEIDKMLAEMN